MSEQQYEYLTHEDTIQAGDEFWAGSAWLEYHEDCIGKSVLVDPSRRPIANANEQPQRERIAYEELKPGDIIQEGDEWWPKDGTGQWQAYHQGMFGLQVLDASIARRPYRVSTILEIGDALADAQKAATQLQDERDKLRAEMDIVKGDRMNLREALAAEQRAHKVTIASGLQACRERDEACNERDLARSEVARLSTGLWARKPLEERVASLTEELAQAREASQQLLQTIADNADQFVWASKTLEQERDEARAERDKLKGLIDDLLNKPTARQVRDMLRAWATELDWLECCFDIATRDKVSAVQRVLGSVIERVESLCSENTDDN